MLELAVVVAIVAILAGLAMPNFSTWIQNSQIRTTAEAIQNGLQLARAEAVRRNTPIRFQLTGSVTASCALSTTGANWVISLDDPSGLCASALINDAFPASDTANNPAPRIVQMRAATEGSGNAVVAASDNPVVFNALGRVTPVPANAISINISNPAGGACVSASPSGPMRCLRVDVSTSGRIRMCDPAFASTDPRGC
jgi:type IV fimbrial biogenesis protein FimT